MKKDETDETGPLPAVAISILLIAPLFGKYTPIQIWLGPLGLNGERILILLVFGCAVFSVLSQKQITISKPDLGIFCLLILLIGSVTWSISPARSFAAVNDLVWYLLFYSALIVFIGKLQPLRQLTRILTIFSVFLVVFAATDLVEPGFSSFLHGVVSYNQFSRDAVALVPILGFAAVRNGGLVKMVQLLLAGSLSVLILFSGSRSGFVGLVVVLCVSAVLYAATVSKHSFARVSVFVIAGSIGVLFALSVGLSSGLLPSRLTRIPMSLAEVFSPEVLGYERYHVYLYEVRTLQEHWLTGIGYGAFEAIMDTRYGLALRAHDPISRMWLGGGVGGVVLFGYVMVSALKNYSRSVANQTGGAQLQIASFGIAFFGITVVGMFNIVIHEPLFYILLAIGCHYIPNESG